MYMKKLSVEIKMPQVRYYLLTLLGTLGTTKKGSIDLLISLFILGDASSIFPTPPTSPTSPQPTTGNFKSIHQLNCFKFQTQS